MSLTAVRPDQAVLDGLSLDAAWQRAKDLEAERDQAKRVASEAAERAEKMSSRYHLLSGGVGALLADYHYDPCPVLAEYMTELVDLLAQAANI